MPNNQPDPELKKLYPSVSAEELKVAEEHLDQYLALAMRVYNRIEKGPVEYARFRRMIGAETLPGKIVNLKDGNSCRKRLGFDSPWVGRHLVIDILRPKKPGI